MSALDKDIKKLTKKLADISQAAIPKADYVALKQTAGQIKTRVIKDVSGETQIQQKHIRKRVYTDIEITKDYRRGRITAYRRKIPAISLGVAVSLVKKAKGRRLVSASRRDTKGRYAKREFAGNTSIKVGRNIYPDAFVNKAKGTWQIMRRKTAKRYPLEVIAVAIAPAVDRFLPSRSREIMKGKYPGLLEYELKRRLKQYEDKS